VSIICAVGRRTSPYRLNTGVMKRVLKVAGLHHVVLLVASQSVFGSETQRFIRVSPSAASAVEGVDEVARNRPDVRGAPRGVRHLAGVAQFGLEAERCQTS